MPFFHLRRGKIKIYRKKLPDTSKSPFVISVISVADNFISFIRFAKYIFSNKAMKNKSCPSAASLRFAYAGIRALNGLSLHGDTTITKLRI